MCIHMYVETFHDCTYYFEDEYAYVIYTHTHIYTYMLKNVNKGCIQLKVILYMSPLLQK